MAPVDGPGRISTGAPRPGIALNAAQEEAERARAQAERERQLREAEARRIAQEQRVKAAQEAYDKATKALGATQNSSTVTAYTDAQKELQSAQGELDATKRTIINLHRQNVEAGQTDPFFQQVKTDPATQKIYDGFDVSPPAPPVKLDAQGQPIVEPESVPGGPYEVQDGDIQGMWGIAKTRLTEAYANARPPRDEPTAEEITKYWQSMVNNNQPGKNPQIKDVNLIYAGNSLDMPGITLPPRDQISSANYLAADGTLKEDGAQKFATDLERGAVQPNDPAFLEVMDAAGKDPEVAKALTEEMNTRRTALLDPNDPASKEKDASVRAAALDAGITAASIDSAYGAPRDVGQDADMVFANPAGLPCSTPQERLAKVEELLGSHPNDPEYAEELLNYVPTGQTKTVAELLTSKETMDALLEGGSEETRKQTIATFSGIAEKGGPAAAEIIGKRMVANLDDVLLGANDRPMTASNSLAGALRARMINGDAGAMLLCGAIAKQFDAQGQERGRDEMAKILFDALDHDDFKGNEDFSAATDVVMQQFADFDRDLGGDNNGPKWIDRAQETGEQYVKDNPPPEPETEETDTQVPTGGGRAPVAV